MIDLTVARIAEIVGGELADISAEAAARLHVTGTVEFDSRAVDPRRAVPGAARRTRRRPRPCGGGGRRPARSRCWPPGRSGCRRSWCAPACGRSDGRAGVLEHDTDGSGAAVLAALAKLAAAVAAELVAGGLTIIGITGSSGKTSTKDLIAAVLAPLGEVVAPPGSFNNELGHPWTVLRATADTDFLVLEMSARHPGNIAALAAIAPPSIAVVLNVGTAHLGEFGSREAIAQTKAELPQAVPASGVVILNADDPAVAAMAEHDRRPGGAGQPAPADRLGPRRVGRTRCRSTNWPGRASRCTRAAHRCRGPAGRARRASGQQRAVRGGGRAGVRRHASSRWPTALAGAGPVSRHRMQVSTRADGVTVINDAYNANPDSMRAGLQALAWMAHGGQQQGRHPGAAGRCWARWPNSATTRLPSMIASAGWPCA